MIDTNLILIEGIAGTGKTTLARRIHSWLQAEGYDSQLVTEFSENHPIHEWEEDSIEPWTANTLNNWKSFTASLVERRAIGIVESTLLQQSIGQLLEWNLDESAIVAVASQVPPLIASASPTLVYLTTKELELHLLHTYHQRSKHWQDKIDGFVQQVEYGRSRSISGMDGFLQFNEDLRRLSDRMVAAWLCPKLQVDVTDYSWHDIEAEVRAFLQLPMT